MSLRWIFGGKKSMYFCKMGFDLPFSGTLNPMKSSRKLSEPSLRRDVRFYDVMPASCIIDTISLLKKIFLSKIFVRIFEKNILKIS